MRAAPQLRPLPEALTPQRLETPAILKKALSANRQLAELKGVAASIPNQAILISTLGLQEAKESSAIENIVTTQDELFRGEVADSPGSATAKEVRLYADALQTGFEAVQRQRLLTGNHILEIQSVLEPNRAGFRKVAGTTLKDGAGRVVYTPPTPNALPDLMG